MGRDFLQKAIDPNQYDSEEIQWEKDGLRKSPSRRFFHDCLRKVLEVKNKSVLDVGSGLGSLFELLKELGATRVVGVEPSSKNVAVSKKLYPQIPILHTTLQDLTTKERFDVVTAVMVFEHIDEISQAFMKIRTLLNTGGKLYMIVSDKKYALTPRSGFAIESEDAGNGMTVTKITRDWGTLYDICRPVSDFITSAKAGGFTLLQEIPCKPTDDLIATKPRYLEFKDVPIAHLLIFLK